MKIGILTHPQHFNYGGILQCFALSTFLEQMGHEVVVINRRPNSCKVKEICVSFLRRCHVLCYYNKNAVERGAKMRSFIEKKLVRTKEIKSNRAINSVCKNYGIQAVVVGSDQVWRADFAMRFGYNYFLDFVPHNVKKISYAASFGLSTWNYTQDQTEKIKELLAGFRGVSVREKDAVTLCKEHLGLEVMQMPDPTLLLSESDYGKLASPRLVEDKYVFVYWLGEKSRIEAKIKEYESQQYKVVYVGLREQRELPSIADWLSYIKYADVVLTDSFHGCVFSIMFKKRLQVFANDSGGNGRVSSLFRIFGVEGYYFNPSECTQTSQVLITLRQEAKKFINNSLR